MPYPATHSIDRMLDFALGHGLLEQDDRCYARNLFLHALGLDAPQPYDAAEEALPATLTPLLAPLIDLAAQRGLIEDTADARDCFGVSLCGLITPSPQAVREGFAARYEQQGPRAATDWFYQLCRDCDYIRVDHIAQNVIFEANSPAGALQITINLSKPEKDPRDIAAALSAAQVDYPACLLCVENPGYAGRPGFPARQNHRIVPVALTGERFYLQYSPYLYYNEHCIVLSEHHRPMKIDRTALNRLFDFVERFPHYFLGSNADLPIVGGSILTHDHFQGGHHRFPMDEAPVRTRLTAPVAGIDAAIVEWPMTCIRLRGPARQPLIDLAVDMLTAWRSYDDPTCGVFHHTTAPHNTLTPIVRQDNGRWVLSLVLRNNRVDDAHPLGIFHPHADLHHIKKENIGLIEVMGLFILPGRLLAELSDARAYLTGARPLADAPAAGEPVAKHYAWIQGIAAETGALLTDEQADAALRRALALKCARVLADAGVYKNDAAGQVGLMRFLSTLGYQ